MSKDIFVIAIAQQLLLDSHLDILVILALLRASHILNPHLSCISHLNKRDLHYCITGGCAVPVTLALSHNGTLNIPFSSKVY